MLRPKKSDVFFRVILCLGIIIILGIAVVFVARAIENSRVKDFWGDESFGLSTAVGMTYNQLLSSGVKGQGSPAPLDYLFLKFLDSVYKPFFVNIPYNVYFRINSIFWDLTGGLLIAFLSLRVFYRRKDNKGIFVLQSALACLALLIFYFTEDNMHYAVETRPYALWNSLWYVMLGLVMLRGVWVWSLLTGILLALTSLGALVQISAMALSQFIFRVIDREWLLDTWIKMMLIFLLPLLIAVYYALHIGQFFCIKTMDVYTMYTTEFLLFWISQWTIPVLSVAGVLLTAWNRQWRGCTVVFLTMLLLYCISPAINSRVMLNGFFFAPRQYLYYDLVFPLFCLMLALVLSQYWMMVFKGQGNDKFK